MAYADLLRDPRWQRKRLEVMQREGFACEECGDTATTLNVHHTYYAKGRNPWEYENDSLRCLCEPCHEKLSELLRLTQKLQGAFSLADAARVLECAVDIQVENDVSIFEPRPQSTDPIVRRMGEIDALLPRVGDAEKNTLLLEKMSLREQYEKSGGRRYWKATR